MPKYPHNILLALAIYSCSKDLWGHRYTNKLVQIVPDFLFLYGIIQQNFGFSAELWIFNTTVVLSDFPLLIL